MFQLSVLSLLEGQFWLNILVWIGFGWFLLAFIAYLIDVFKQLRD